MRSVLVLLIVVGTAHADDAVRLAAIDAAFDHQLEMVRTHDNLLATMAPDARIAVDGYAPGTYPPIYPWMTDKTVTITAKRTGWSNNFGWLVAELAGTMKPYTEPEPGYGTPPGPEHMTLHWIEVFVPDGDGVKGIALGISRTVEDSDLARDTDTAVDPSPPAVLAAITTGKSKFLNDPGAAIFGAGAGQYAFGSSAKKLLKHWDKLAPISKPRVKSWDQDLRPVEITAGDATITWAVVRVKLPNRTIWRNLSVFAIARKDELVALSFAAY